MTVTLSELNAAEPERFVGTLGGIFEHSPWVAEAVVAERPFGSVDALHAAMTAAIEGAGEEAQLTLIRAHPDLAGKAAISGGLTAESTSEQKGAGLDQLTEAEYARFHELNEAYKSKFGFPFILAVRGHDKHSILASFERRLGHDKDEEREEALQQIYRIGAFRLNDLIEE